LGSRSWEPRLVSQRNVHSLGSRFRSKADSHVPLPKSIEYFLPVLRWSFFMPQSM
jgi:hypothetical protein